MILKGLESGRLTIINVNPRTFQKPTPKGAAPTTHFSVLRAYHPPLSHESDIGKVQEWLGHANVSTMRLYDWRKSKPEDSPTFRVKY